MRALQYAEYGPPEVLRVVDVEEPHAVAGQIRVAVKAVGVNPVDWKVRKGLMKGALPAIPCSDVAGVVDEVGADVAGVSTGDEVFGFRCPVGPPSTRSWGTSPPCPRACPSPRRRGYRWRSRPRFGSSGFGAFRRPDPAHQCRHRRRGRRRGAARQGSRRPRDRHGQSGQPRVPPDAGRRPDDLRRGLAGAGCQDGAPRRGCRVRRRWSGRTSRVDCDHR
jgi:hypothetical protein